MKVDRIIPCICIEHEPESAVDGAYGRPELQLYGGFDAYSYSFIPKCPVCGRGGLHSFPSAYKALKDWNEMQKDLWDYECFELDGRPRKDTPMWRHELYKKLFKEDHHESN